MRKDQHDRITWAVSYRLREGDWPGKPVSGVLHNNEFQARHGGAGEWIDLPVQLFPEYAGKGEVNRGERS